MFQQFVSHMNYCLVQPSIGRFIFGMYVDFDERMARNWPWSTIQNDSHFIRIYTFLQPTQHNEKYLGMNIGMSTNV